MPAKLLIDAVGLRDLLSKSPEVEVELVRNAAAQIAEVFKRKVLDKQSDLQRSIVDDLVRDINERLNYKYRLPDHVLGVIKSACDDHLQAAGITLAKEAVDKTFAKALSRIEGDLERKVDALAQTIVERKVGAVFAAAAKLGRT